MKFTKYILSLLVIVFAVSCTIDDEFEPTKGYGDKVQIISRLVPFHEHDVLSRAEATDGVNEDYISSYDYIIFANLGNAGSVDPTDYVCVFYRHYNGSDNQIVPIDLKTEFTDKFGENDPQLNECRIVLLANMPQLYNKISDGASAIDAYKNADGTINVEQYIADKIEYKGVNLENYVRGNYFYDVKFTHPGEGKNYTAIPNTGLPRMGDYGQVVNFNEVEPGTQFPIQLQSLYAKIVFDISVKETQPGLNANTNVFYLDKYIVNNVVKEVDMIGGIESMPGSNSHGEKITKNANGNETKEQVSSTNDANPVFAGEPWSVNVNGEAQGSKSISFTFYLPERYLQATTAANSYDYPFRKGGTTTTLGTIRPEDEKLRQRYKPLLVSEEKKATYVTLSGRFINHQGHSYDVDYDIYLGKDNYGNFDIVRNYQYNNNVIIKGIESSSDQSNITDGDGNLIAVSIDHRVNVTRTSPIIVNFRREMLLDAHFEVRPLRILLNQNYGDPSGLTAKVEVLTYAEDANGNAIIGGTDPNNPTRPDWIRLERSYGDGGYSNGEDVLYCYNGELGASSNGKRKYFTYNLVSGKNAAGNDDLQNTLKTSGVSVEVPLSDLASNSTEPNPAGCVWVYVDECLEASTNKESVRQAVVRVTCGDEVIDYVVNQHRLYKVVYDEREYYIEHEEEYLHNFDADDNYDDNQTEFQGMEWGLYHTQLSFETEALIFDSKISGVLGWIVDWVINSVKSYLGVEPKYDFYITKHDDEVNAPEAAYSDYAGLAFTKKIVNDINGVTGNSTGYVGRNGRDNNIEKLKLNQLPHSAIEYCYNRNKRNYNGTITTNNITWYMPAIDEMEDVIVAAYGEFPEFQEQFYWSCQPAYLRHYAYYKGLGTYRGSFYIDDIGYYLESESAGVKEKSKGRARATMAIPKQGTTEFDYIKSGLPQDVYDDAYNILDRKIICQPSFDGKTLYDWSKYVEANKTTWMDYEEGNKLRTDKCRVRALVDKTKVKEVND